jgi:FAD/FMN-containing dehydrogenase
MLEPVRAPLLRRALGGRALRNVSNTRSIDPLREFHASGLDDVVALVRRAEADKTTVKAIGSRHSWSDVELGGGYVLRPMAGELALDHVRQGVDTARLLRVQGGTRVREVNELLDARGLALANMGGYDGQTLRGRDVDRDPWHRRVLRPAGVVRALDRPGRLRRRRAPDRAARRHHRPR